MKFLALGLILFAASASQAMSFELPCTPDKQLDGTLHFPKNVRYSVVKTVKNDGQKWVASYSVKAVTASGTTYFKLVSAGTGDEDYNDYSIPKSENLYVSGASIQNRFQWASLMVQGYAAYDCRAQK